MLTHQLKCARFFFQSIAFAFPTRGGPTSISAKNSAPYKHLFHRGRGEKGKKKSRVVDCSPFGDSRLLPFSSLIPISRLHTYRSIYSPHSLHLAIFFFFFFSICVCVSLSVKPFFSCKPRYGFQQTLSHLCRSSKVIISP